ncbi:M20 family metallopeptidase [Dokdonella sp.]|jgi:acetylornithine deacetylase/succinyl-diaminopimelate desuccinylase-like protein|uniref:M20 family metallopeptidase n=1 Tax=Dokdonella sp. TaxID=2291710 RepID=UPI002C2F826D|nr:M20 family metallopeptidase [Dokdonella sp.]HNV09463.1 M20 family metallopeptidase [Dokdonella sp.]HPW05202.1 M20 family metallopeptidase [Dokdonella sp.]
MDPRAISSFVGDLWDSQIVPQLVEYIRIPNKSPMFDAKWAEHGYMDQAVDLMQRWARAQPIPGMQLEVVRLEGRTPLIFIEIPGTGDDCVLLYGHLDKQPEMTGWAEHLGPWKPVIEGDKLFGRGGADDGYAIFGSLAAILALQAQKIPHARCVVMIEACEESGSYDLPYYVDHLASRIGKPSLIVCLDSGCGNYEQMWLTTSLRGMTGGNLTVTVLDEGVHSGDASGVVASSFRILRQVLSRLEDENTGHIKPESLHMEIPPQRREQAKRSADVLGDAIYSKFPLHQGMQPVSTDLSELVLNRTWRPALSITGVSGLPSLDSAGNVLRPFSAVKLSLRLPPTANAPKCGEFLKQLLEADPPYGASVQFALEKAGSGWDAPALAPWLEKSVDEASRTFFGPPPAYMGEGGSIPFMGMLGEKFPGAQFLITGVLGPHSNAHGPNEFLHIPTGKRVSACVAKVVADHYQAGLAGLTRGVAATDAHTHKGEDGCC